jgi:ferrochelatase
MSSSPRRAVLLVNLGSPASTSVPDVRRYLAEFLLDERVIDSPWLVRQLVVRAFILPSRPRESSKAYSSVWTPEGAPLIVISRRVRDALAARVPEPVHLAMRYGEPSIPAVVRQIVEAGVDELFLVPLYPHYAMSSYETVVVAVQEALRALGARLRLVIQNPFFDDPRYIDALAAVARPHLEEPYDHFLFSYHGIPERHLRKGDASRAHCLECRDCCDTAHPAHAMCYRAQTRATSRALVSALGIPEGRWSIAYQSRLGRDPWITPYTDFELERLPGAGVKRLVIICPAFVSDCLETLEEIHERGRETFLHAGGESFRTIPCLNEHPQWISVLESFTRSAFPHALPV